jgi:hypothetical protein
MDLGNFAIRTRQDLFDLPGYEERVDPTRRPLKRVLKHYHLSALAQCGLSSCGQWHYDGYVVELEDGGLTNVGHVCGSQFGERFAIEERAYQERVLKPQLIRRLSEGRSEVERLRPAIDQVADRIRTVLRRRAGLRARFPAFAEDLRRRAMRGEDQVVDAVERTAQEIEELLAINPQQNREALRYKEVPRGRIAGLRFLGADTAAATLDALQQRRDEFFALEGLNAMAIDRLFEWERWINGLDDRLKEADRLAADGEAFFTAENFKIISLLAQDEKQRKAISAAKPLDFDSVSGTSLHVDTPAKKLNRRERRRQQFR